MPQFVNSWARGGVTSRRDLRRFDEGSHGSLCFLFLCLSCLSLSTSASSDVVLTSSTSVSSESSLSDVWTEVLSADAFLMSSSLCCGVSVLRPPLLGVGVSWGTSSSELVGFSCCCCWVLWLRSGRIKVCRVPLIVSRASANCWRSVSVLKFRAPTHGPLG